MKQPIAKLLRGLSTVLVIFAIIIAFLISGMRIFGFQVYGVLTGSMEPTYPVGSLIYVKDVDANTLRVNDVITFSLSPNVVATHRIVELVPDEANPAVTLFRTKGDANDDVDASLVGERNIIGKVSFCVPMLGHMASYIQEPPGIYVAIIVCLLMIGFVVYTDSLTGEKPRKNQPAQAQKKPAFDFVAAVNKLSVKLMGKPLIKQKPQQQPRQGYQPQQQPYGYPQQQYNPQAQQQPYGYQQQPYQYPQQHNPQAQQQPYGYQQQPYGYPQQQQYNPQAQQQPYGYQQQPYGYQQQYNPQAQQQPYGYPQQQPYGYQQPHNPQVQQQPYGYPQQPYNYPQQGMQQPQNNQNQK